MCTCQTVSLHVQIIAAVVYRHTSRLTSADRNSLQPAYSSGCQCIYNAYKCTCADGAEKNADLRSSDSELLCASILAESCIQLFITRRLHAHVCAWLNLCAISIHMYAQRVASNIYKVESFCMYVHRETLKIIKYMWTCKYYAKLTSDQKWKTTDISRMEVPHSSSKAAARPCE